MWSRSQWVNTSGLYYTKARVPLAVAQSSKVAHDAHPTSNHYFCLMRQTFLKFLSLNERCDFNLSFPCNFFEKQALQNVANRVRFLRPPL